ncbi:MAG TPA: long-chain fatty acid--CoA ligase [Methylomirabilota bacterium]|jgi:long-chain acyl-CoA synthetase|nr:long-chain fatty acid--CoA ligase [Methylomirabilota bacterium]
MAADTLARMFWEQVERSGDRPAQQFKHGAGWTTITWREVGETVRELALGLLALGRAKGDSVALLSSSRAEWVQADFAIFTAGCVTVPVYPSYPPDLIAYIVNDSGARTIIVEDPAQLAKVLQAREKTPNLEHIIVISDYDAPQPPKMVMTWESLRRLGRENAGTGALGSLLAERVASTRPTDLATIVYTSGTTGPPKGVMQTHGNHIAAVTASKQATPVEEGWVHLLFLPLAHSFARLESFLGVAHGLTTAFAENLDKVGENLRETRPHFICSVPRVFEKVYGRILAGVEAGSPAKKKIFNWAVSVGRDVSRHQQRGQPVPTTLELKRKIAHKLVFSKLHAALGGRLRWAVSGGAPLSRDIAEFFHAAGILLLEGYGLTETCPVLTFNRPDRYKFGSVGQTLPGVQVQIAADGEILARGPNIATLGYFKQPEATHEVFGADGWFHTGDIGTIDGDGFLFITDRKKDLIVTAGGMNIAPQNIENLLKADPFISQVMVYGDRRPYPVALITVNSDELSKFAREQGILTSEAAAIVKHPKVVERVGRTVEEKNTQLQSYARIKRFTVLPTDFTLDGGELTPTLKVKRKVVSQKYQDAIEELYR